MPFTSLKLHPNLLKGIKELGFVRPTPIQADAVPPALAGQDVLACAMTGSGKTAAFLFIGSAARPGRKRWVTRSPSSRRTRRMVSGGGRRGGGTSPAERTAEAPADMDEAVRIASHFPWARTGCVEVRPMQDIDAVRRRVNDSEAPVA